MTLYVTSRLLTPEELVEFRKKEIGRLAAGLNTVAIMGLTTNTKIRFLSTKRFTYNVDLGGGQYWTETASSKPAPQGRTIPVLWGVDSTYAYVFSATKELRIPIFFEIGIEPRTLDYCMPGPYNAIYFDGRYVDALLDAFHYVDISLSDFCKAQSFIDRLFNGIGPKYGSAKNVEIRAKVKKILSGA